MKKGSPMSFEEIAEVLGISKAEVKRIYDQAIRKLQTPNEKNKKFWEYVTSTYHDHDDKDIRFE